MHTGESTLESTLIETIEGVVTTGSKCNSETLGLTPKRHGKGWLDDDEPRSD